MRTVILFLGLLLLTSCAGNHYKFKSEAIDLFIDNPTDIIGKPSLQIYFAHYYSPWTDQNHILTNSEILDAEQDKINRYTINPGWAENTYPHDKAWIQKITSNINIETFPNANQKAMIIHHTNLRSLPTNEPSFGDPKEAGEGYPFDNLQESFLTVDTPVLILQTTKDKSWSLVLTAGSIGWVPSEDVMDVNNTFIHSWQKKDFVAITKDNVSIIDKNKFLFQSHIGAIFPLIAENKNQYIILVASPDFKQIAISKENAIKMPMAFTQQNVSGLIKSLVGNKYGWGGVYHYRDCSSTLQDLFTPFGIWLPRNSGDQLHSGKFTSLENLSTTEKENVIKSHAIPFATLIGYPGHIMLYVGQYQNKPYVFQDLWGLHTSFLGKNGRAIIGQTVISPLDWGKNDINVAKTQLEKATGMSNLIQ